MFCSTCGDFEGTKVKLLGGGVMPRLFRSRGPGGGEGGVGGVGGGGCGVGAGGCGAGAGGVGGSGAGVQAASAV